MLFTEMLDKEESYAFDQDHIGAKLGAFSKQCSDALFLATQLPKKEREFQNLILCGVGGSALAGAFMKNIWEYYGQLPVYVHRNYGMPSFANAASCVIALSYSGNTEETLSSFRAAAEKKCEILGVTSGGTLAALCKEQHQPCLLLPSGFQPRMATLLMTLPLLEWFRANQWCEIPHSAFGELYFRLLELGKRWGMASPSKQNRAKVTAFQLYGKTPLIWGSQGLSDVAAVNMKNQLNETAKSVAFCNSLPEANHNEIMSFQKKRQDYGVVAFRNPYESSRLKKRFLTSETLLQEKVGFYGEFAPAPLSYLTTLGESIYFGNWVAYYLSVLYKEDPKEIKGIEEFKARMAR